MHSRMRNVYLVPAILLQCAVFAGCGLSGEQLASVSVSPSSFRALAGESIRFTATVAGAGSQEVFWSVNDVPGGDKTVGRIDPSGLYQAPVSPPTPSTVTISATSLADPRQKGAANVEILPPGQVSATAHPQVARYSITTPRDAMVTVEFGPKTTYGQQTWSVASPPGGGPVEILVAGMRATTTYHMRAIVEYSDGAVHTDRDHLFTTGALPAERVPLTTATFPGNFEPNSGVTLLSLIGGSTLQVRAAAVDMEGQLIWFYDYEGITDNPFGNIPFPIKPRVNGNFLITIGFGAPVLFREITLEGEILRELSVPELNSRLADVGFTLEVFEIHHDYLDLPTGQILLLVDSFRVFTDLPGLPGETRVQGDALVALDENWQPFWVWDAFDHLDVNRQPMGFPDWTHGNSLAYLPDDGNVLVSLRHQHWVLKVDYQDGTGTGEVLWKLGHEGDFAMEGSGPAGWFYGQHFPFIVGPSSSIIFDMAIFDNGNNRVLDDSGTICGTDGAPPCFSRAVIFRIEEATRNARILWEYDLGVFAPFISNVGVFENGNVEIGIGPYSLFPRLARALEVTQEVVPQALWQLDIEDQWAYRAVRIPSLYPGVMW